MEAILCVKLNYSPKAKENLVLHFYSFRLLVVQTTEAIIDNWSKLFIAFVSVMTSLGKNRLQIDTFIYFLGSLCTSTLI